MDRGTAIRAALMAGVLGVFIQMIPLLGIVLTGALAVFFYRRESRIVLPTALGSRLGGAAGVAAFAINALLITVRIFVFHAQQEYIDLLTRYLRTRRSKRGGPRLSSQHPRHAYSVGAGDYLLVWDDHCRRARLHGRGAGLAVSAAAQPPSVIQPPSAPFSSSALLSCFRTRMMQRL